VTRTLVSVCLLLCLLCPWRTAEACLGACSRTASACCAEACTCCDQGCSCSAQESPDSLPESPVQAPAPEAPRVPTDFSIDRSLSALQTARPTSVTTRVAAPCASTRSACGRVVLLRTGHLLH